MNKLKFWKEPTQVGNRLDYALSATYNGIEYSIYEYPLGDGKSYQPHISITNWRFLDNKKQDALEYKVNMLGYALTKQGSDSKFRHIHPVKGYKTICPGEVAKRVAMCIDIIEKLVA
jgi:hypothetical protein